MASPKTIRKLCKNCKVTFFPLCKEVKRGWGIFCSVSCKTSASWKGEKASYKAKHKWLYKNFGKASLCENKEQRLLDFKCSETCKLYEWANKSGEYLRDRTDFFQLCISCHRKYDFSKEPVYAYK